MANQAGRKSQWVENHSGAPTAGLERWLLTQLTHRALSAADQRRSSFGPLAIQEVIDGRVDALINDDANVIPTFQKIGSANVVLCCPVIAEPGSPSEIRSTISLLTSEVYGMAVRFGDEDLLHWLNLFIEQTKTTIVVTDELAKTYKLKSDAIGQPILSALRAKWGL